jgi:ATP-dependent DNA helicase HFM1/MER3
VGKIPFELIWYTSHIGCFCVLTKGQLLNKKQASGHKILSVVRELPQYSVTIQELAIAHTTVGSGGTVDVEVDIQCSVSLDGTSSSKSKGQRGRLYQDMTYILTVTSDLDFIDFRRIPLSPLSQETIDYTLTKSSHSTKALQDPKSFSVTAQLTKPSQSIWVYMSSVSPIRPGTRCFLYITTGYRTPSLA